MMRSLIGIGKGYYAEGYTLVNKYKGGAVHFIGEKGIHLSGLASRQCGGKIEIPGYRGLGWNIGGELLSSGEAKFYTFEIGHKISWKKFHNDKKRTVNLVDFIEKCVNDVIRVSEYLEMPKMLEYKDEIIQTCKRNYITYYIKPKFGSTDLRFQKKFDAELNRILKELEGLAKWFTNEEVRDYINKVTTEAHESKTKEAGLRKKKRDAAAARKRLRESKKNVESVQDEKMENEPAFYLIHEEMKNKKNSKKRKTDDK